MTMGGERESAFPLPFSMGHGQNKPYMSKLFRQEVVKIRQGALREWNNHNRKWPWVNSIIAHMKVTSKHSFNHRKPIDSNLGMPSQLCAMLMQALLLQFWCGIPLYSWAMWMQHNLWWVCPLLHMTFDVHQTLPVAWRKTPKAGLVS